MPLGDATMDTGSSGYYHWWTNAEPAAETICRDGSALWCVWGVSCDGTAPGEAEVAILCLAGDCVAWGYSRLLYHLIREIKMWLNINHITVHNNIFQNSKNSYCKYKSSILNKLVIYVIYTHTHIALRFEQIHRFRNGSDCRLDLILVCKIFYQMEESQNI